MLSIVFGLLWTRDDALRVEIVEGAACGRAVAVFFVVREVEIGIHPTIESFEPYPCDGARPVFVIPGVADVDLAACLGDDFFQKRRDDPTRRGEKSETESERLVVGAFRSRTGRAR